MKAPNTPNGLKFDNQSKILSWESDDEALNVVTYKDIDLPGWKIWIHTKEKQCIFNPVASDYLVRVKSGFDVDYSDNSEIIEINL
jgi:hypothetical protein